MLSILGPSIFVIYKFGRISIFICCFYAPSRSFSDLTHEIVRVIYGIRCPVFRKSLKSLVSCVTSSVLKEYTLKLSFFTIEFPSYFPTFKVEVYDAAQKSIDWNKIKGVDIDTFRKRAIMGIPDGNLETIKAHLREFPMFYPRYMQRERMLKHTKKFREKVIPYLLGKEGVEGEEVGEDNSKLGGDLEVGEISEEGKDSQEEDSAGSNEVKEMATNGIAAENAAEKKESDTDGTIRVDAEKADESEKYNSTQNTSVMDSSATVKVENSTIINVKDPAPQTKKDPIDKNADNTEKPKLSNPTKTFRPYQRIQELTLNQFIKNWRLWHLKQRLIEDDKPHYPPNQCMCLGAGALMFQYLKNFYRSFNMVKFGKKLDAAESCQTWEYWEYIYTTQIQKRPSLEMRCLVSFIRSGNLDLRFSNK